MNFKRILNVVGALLLIAIVVPFVIYAVPAVVGADHSFVVLTASMTPAIAPGDVVVVSDRGPATIAEGDVITFTRGNNEVPVTHRVTAVTEGAGGLAFETKGDANSDVDSSLVPAGSVIGTVILTIPYIGYVVQFTNTPYGFVALVAGPIGLFVASEIWTLYRRRSGARAAASVPEPEVESDNASNAANTPEFVITSRTLEGAIPPLVALAAYSAYTMYLRPGELTIAVAVGSATTLLAVGALWWGARGDNNPSADADGGSTPTDTEPMADSDDSSETGRPTADGGTEEPSAVSGAPDTVIEEHDDESTVER